MILIALIFAFSACATDPQIKKASPVLVDVHQGEFDRVLMPRGEAIPPFTRIRITEPTVEMSDHWRRTHRGEATSRDLERIKQDYGRFLRSSLAQALEGKANVKVVEAGQPADIVLRPSLLRLNIYAPDLAGKPARTRQYIEAAGNATLQLEFVDPTTGRVLAQIIDHRETSPLVLGRLERTSRVTNNRLFIRLMERWSHHLVQYLEKEGAVDIR